MYNIIQVGYIVLLTMILFSVITTFVIKKYFEQEKANYVIYLEARNHLYKYDRVVYTTKKEAKAEILKAYKNENNNNATFLIVSWFKKPMEGQIICWDKKIKY